MKAACGAIDLLAELAETRSQKERTQGQGGPT